MKKRLFGLAAFLLTALPLMAQGSSDDFFRSTGKLYVVVAVLLSMFIGIVIYLYNLDRKIKNLEKQIKNE